MNAKKTRAEFLNTKTIFWGIFIALLLVLLPHTAWFFAQFESDEPVFLGGLDLAWIRHLTAYAAAFAFEAAIAALVHKLAEHIEQAKVKPGKARLWARRLTAHYANIYTPALLLVVSVSSVANYAHAVEFGKPIKVFTQLGIPLEVYSLIAGAILPFCSLLFARVLSKTVDTEQETDPELDKAKEENKGLKAKLNQANKQLDESEARMKLTEQKFGEYAGLFGATKKERVLAAHQIWNGSLPYSSLEIITGASPAYISEVLKSANGVEVHS